MINLLGLKSKLPHYLVIEYMFYYIVKMDIHHDNLSLTPHFYIHVVELGFIQGYTLYSYLRSKTPVVGTHEKHLDEAVQTGTHNPCSEQKYENCKQKENQLKIAIFTARTL